MSLPCNTEKQHPPFGHLKFIQINLNHCKAANEALKPFMTSNRIDIALLQDAYCDREGALTGVPSNWVSFPSKKKSAHLVIQNTNLCYSHLFTGDHCVFITITAKEGKLSIGSTYAAPKTNFDDSLEEWEHLITQRQFFICGGDFNASSTLWGYTQDTIRGDSLVEHLSINRLSIANINNTTPTFVKKDIDGNIIATGFPDHTLVNPKTEQKLRHWHVSDVHSASDHTYITFDFEITPLYTTQRRFNTTRGNYKKFTQIIKNNKPLLAQRLKDATNTTHINEVTKELIATMQTAARATFRLKNTRRTPIFSFWSSELKTKRNHLTALRKKLKKLRLTDPDTQYYRDLSAKYKINSAKFKRSVLDARTAAWRKFCSNQTDPYGTAQKFFTGKFFTPHEIKLELPPSRSSRQSNMEHLTSVLFGPSSHPIRDNSDINFTSPPDIPFTNSELSAALKTLNDKKAPGPDCVDFKILKLAYKIIPKLFTSWANLCLKHSYFPEALRQGEVVYFLKQGKDATEPSSYRPICLLPTLGKLLEKLLVGRLVHFLETNNLLHHRQYGFRVGRSCDKALFDILSACEESIAKGNYTSLVSLDIKGAFDNVEWRDILLILKDINCPSNIAGIIGSYLSLRSILINWGPDTSSHNLEKGCPQGSCLGPILWLLVANIILVELERLGFTLFAFADDFSFVFSGRTRLDIELAAARALTAFYQLITRLHLQLSPGKSQELTFAKPHKLIRRPVMRIDGVSVKHVHHLKLLGITIDEHRSWTEHVNTLRTKLEKLNINARKLTSKTWGIKPTILKIWYHTIVERILLYGVSVWGGNLTKAVKDKLTSLQRTFLLPMARGYKTVSTDALAVITGIPPIIHTMTYEYQKQRILHLNHEQTSTQLFPQTIIQKKVPSWQLHPAEETSHFQVNPAKHSYSPTRHHTIFTDGSRTESGVAAAFCTMEGSTVTHEWACRIGDDNSVYQAELFAILQALEWLVDSKSNTIYYLYSDCLSGLQAIFQHKTTHPLVLQIKLVLNNLIHKVSLGHVTAHIGVAGNELADSLAKEATSRPEINHSLPVPPSHIRRSLKLKLMSTWQDHWNNSPKGRHTYSLIPKVSRELRFLSPSTTAFLTGHGPFRKYLNYYKISRTDVCECGDLGSPEHYYYSCTLTAAWHIRSLSTPPRSWLHNILSRPKLLRNLSNIYNHLMILSNLTD